MDLKKDNAIPIKGKNKMNDREKMLEYFQFTGEHKDKVSVAEVNKIFIEKFDQKNSYFTKYDCRFWCKKEKKTKWTIFILLYMLQTQKLFLFQIIVSFKIYNIYYGFMFCRICVIFV